MACRAWTSIIGPIRCLRKFVLLALLMPVLAGCGSDDNSSPPAQTAELNLSTTTSTTETQPTLATETQPNDGNGQPGSATTTSPEDQQGGAGDETPAETQALFTGKGGRITPSVVRVPAYISVVVFLRSGDGADYGLTFDGKTITPGGKGVRLAGLKPGAKVVGKSTTDGGQVRIEATAEPGP
jgi:hypothetical protein